MQWLLRIALFLALVGLAVFLPAGSLFWVRGWILLVAYFTLVGLFLALLKWKNPALIEARARTGEGTKRFDRVFVVVWTLLLLGLMVVSGLDAERFRWAPLPGWTVLPGLGLMLLASVPIGWAGVHNPHMEGTVRIQEDRGHRVIATGPYARVRHPMYVGALLWLLSVPLIVGSAWAYVPAGLAFALMVWRTWMEDRTLQRELPGYAEYARKTRFRLVPGLW